MGRRRFEEFCQRLQLTPYPTSERVLLHFVASLGQDKLSHQTIKVYLASIRHIHVLRGLAFIGSSPRVHLLVQGIKRVNGVVNRPRLPITDRILRKLKTALKSNPSSYQNVMLWAACNVGFFGFLRCGEFVVPDGVAFNSDIHLTIADVSFDNRSSPKVASVRIKASKTDPFRVGVTIYLPKTSKDLCPVESLLAYLNYRGFAPGPLFCLENKQPLRRSLFVQLVRNALGSQGIDSVKYSGHSFRIGAATTAAQVGIPESCIKLLGRWDSSAYQSYIKTPQDQLVAFAARLVDS